MKKSEVPEKIKACLKELKWCLTGSCAMLKGLDHPCGDVDICILCPTNLNPLDIISKFDNLEKENAFLEAEYDIPFDWGGKTYLRYKYSIDEKAYDFFIVDRPTYKTIQKVSKIIPQLVWEDTSNFIENNITTKSFRIALFQLFCKAQITEYLSKK